MDERPEKEGYKERRKEVNMFAPQLTRIEITPSGISGLDRLLAGGFMKGAIILVAGNPGTGKSTLAAKFIYEGLKRGEPGIYVNFVEPRQDFYAHMESLGADFEKYEKQGLFRYVEALTIADDEALAQQLEDIIGMAMDMNAKRLVVDSVTVMLQILGKQKSRIRELLQNFFVNGLKPLGVTSILVAEHPYGAQVVGEGVEEFVVDAVFILRTVMKRGKPLRIMEIRKVRWAPIRFSEVTFYIRPYEMIDIVLPEELEEIPPPDYSTLYNLCTPLIYGSRTNPPLVVLDMHYIRRRQIIEEVCPRLVLSRDAQIAIGLDMPVSSRFLVTLLAGLEKAIRGAKILIISFKTSAPALREITECLAKQLSKQLGSRNGGSVHVISLNPSAYTVHELLLLMRFAVEHYKPDILIIEGVELLEALHPREEILPELYNFVLWNKRKRVLGVFIHTMPGKEAMQRFPLISTYDAVVFISTAPRLLGKGSEDPLRQIWTLEAYHGSMHIECNVVVYPVSVLKFTCMPRMKGLEIGEDREAGSVLL